MANWRIMANWLRYIGIWQTGTWRNVIFPESKVEEGKVIFCSSMKKNYILAKIKKEAFLIIRWSSTASKEKKRVRNWVLQISDGSGSNIFWPGLGRVSHIWFWFWFGKFPLKCQIFNYFLFRSKKSILAGSNAGWPLIYCGSKVSSGWVRAHLY